MRLLLVLVFVGVAFASPHDELMKASEDVIESFFHGISEATPLHKALEIENTEEVERFERELKEKLTKYLKEEFEKAFQKVKDAVDKGQEIHKGAFQKLIELRDQMKDLNIRDDEVGDKVLQELKDIVKDRLRELLETFGVLEENSPFHADVDEEEPISNIFEDFNIRNFFIRLKESVLSKMNVDSLKKSLAKVIGQGTQRLCEWLTDKGKTKVLDFFDRILEKDDEDKRKRSVSDLYDEVKDYFEDLDLELKQKFMKFGEWVKEVLSKGLEKSHGKIQNIKAIAKQLLDINRIITKEVAEQALEYLRNYKEELGNLYNQVYGKLMKRIMDDYTD